MPCDTIQINRVEIGAMNPVLLTRALKALGARDIVATTDRVRFSLDGDYYQISGGAMQSIVSDVGSMADRVKRAYSAEVVKYSAQKQGWTLKEVRPFVYEVQK